MSWCAEPLCASLVRASVLASLVMSLGSTLSCLFSSVAGLMEMVCSSSFMNCLSVTFVCGLELCWMMSCRTSLSVRVSSFLLIFSGFSLSLLKCLHMLH